MNEFTRWLLWKEGQTFERKSCYDKSQDPPKRIRPQDVAKQIAETMCAMANADGGVLLVGQEDLVEGQEETTGKVTGVDYPEDKLRLLHDSPQSLILPPLEGVDVHEAVEDGKRLLLFQTGSSPIAHRLTDGRCVLRIGKSNAPFSEQSIAHLKQSQSPYERRPVPGATLDDLDSDALKWFAEKIGYKADAASMLASYDLYDGNYLNRAALLLFAKKPLHWQDHTDVTVVRYEGTERGLGPRYSATPILRIEAPLVRLIERAHAEVRRHLRKRVGLVDLFFEEQLEYPEFAWQEAIVNAIGHRDYALTGMGIEVWLFDDRMEVRSPGLPPSPLTAEILQTGKKIHFSRNPLVTRVLADAGYMREQGEGIPRMIETMESADLLPPAFETVVFLLQVTLRNTPVYDTETVRWLRQFDELGLTRDQRRILAYAKAHGMYFTNHGVQKLLKLDLYSASNLIKTLIRKGIVRLIEKGGRVYEVISKPEKETLPKEVAILIPAFEKHEALSNRLLQELWDIPGHRAYRLARSLVDAGWLELRGSKRAAAYYLTERSRKADSPSTLQQS